MIVLWEVEQQQKCVWKIIEIISVVKSQKNIVRLYRKD